MNPNRLHDHHSFFKHTSSCTAKIILASRKLRWSMPKLFNDPFDIPPEIFDGINEPHLRDALVDRMTALVKEAILPRPEHHTMLTRLLLEMFRHADDKTKNELIAANEESRNDPVSLSEGFRLLREQWRSEYRDMRVLCFTERWDSASMWDRYSEGHTGVSLEFACLDEVDSAWLTAKPVTYSDEPLKCNTAEGLANLLLYNPDFAIPMIMEEYTHTKTADWAYEKEWRIASWKRPHESGDYSDYGFLPTELIGITFGASILEADKRDLELMLREQYHHVVVWQASIAGGRKLNRTKQSANEQGADGNPR